MKNSTTTVKGILAAAALLIGLSANALTDALKIKIAGNGYSDETVIRFLGDATTDFDGSYDAWKLFSSNSNVPSLYTRIDSLSFLSINAYPALDKKYTFDLCSLIPKTGSYSISAVELGSFASGVTIIMQDLQTGNYYDLRDTSSHAFSMLLNTNKSAPARFRIVFSPVVTTSVAGTDAGTDVSIKVWQNAQGLNVLPSCKGRVQVSLFSALGQLVSETEMENAEGSAVILPVPAPGVYIVRLQHSSGVISRSCFLGNQQ